MNLRPAAVFNVSPFLKERECKPTILCAIYGWNQLRVAVLMSVNEYTFIWASGSGKLNIHRGGERMTAREGQRTSHLNWIQEAEQELKVGSG